MKCDKCQCQMTPYMTSFRNPFRITRLKCTTGHKIRITYGGQRKVRVEDIDKSEPVVLWEEKYSDAY